MASTVTSSRPNARTHRELLLKSFEEPVRPPRASILYTCGLLVVATAMVLLPVIYLGLIAAMGYGLYYHATENAVIMEGRGGMRGRLFVFVAPLVIGVVLLIFMIKPLFARFPADDRRVSLTPTGEPFLYEFVQALCRCIGAPVPKRIDVDMSVNAAAGFRRGLLSFLGNDLVLIIGLPLAAGLSARELAGVMAHEFGHFTQGLAMRLGYVIRRINGWFERVVYQRDSWDEQLAAWADQAGGSLWILARLTMLCVWLTRRTLWVLMVAGHAICCFMDRQMEYNADAYEIQAAGSRAFAATFEKLALLDVAQPQAGAELDTMYQERRLPDNYPLYMQTVVGRVPQGLAAALQKHIRDTHTGWFSTHPAVGARIQRAEAMDAEGVIGVDCPAAELFSDFELLCRETSRIYYGWALDSNLNHVKFVPLAAAKGEQEAAGQERSALERYLQGLWRVDRPLGLRIDEFKLPLDAAEPIARLKRTRQKIEAALAQARALFDKYLDARERAGKGVRAKALLRAGFAVDAASFGVDAPTTAAANALEAGARAEADKLLAKLEPFDAAQRKRLLTALGLLSLPEVGGKIHGAADLLAQCETYLIALGRLDAVIERMMSMSDSLTAIGTLADALNGKEAQPVAMAVAVDLGRQIHTEMAEVRAQLDDDPYPFEHAEGSISIGVWAVELPLSADNLRAVTTAAAEALNRLATLYRRLIARLTSAAEQVETQIGLKPLPSPPAEKTSK